MLDWPTLPARMNDDPEFRLAARHWTATLRLDVGERSHALRIEDGVVAGIAEAHAGDAADVFVGASEAEWQELLAPLPRPFYQDLSGAAIHHGVRLPHDMTAYAAYYPALRRLVQLMRDARAEGV